MSKCYTCKNNLLDRKHSPAEEIVKCAKVCKVCKLHNMILYEPDKHNPITEKRICADLEYLLAPGETHAAIIAGHCTCGEPYALIKGSNKTFWKNGDRYAHCVQDENGWSVFRCSKCGKCIEHSFTPDRENEEKKKSYAVKEPAETERKLCGNDADKEQPE